VRDALATDRLRATDEIAVFGTHLYTRSSRLARAFPTATWITRSETQSRIRRKGAAPG
jgi:hypothetical protein